MKSLIFLEIICLISSVYWVEGEKEVICDRQSIWNWSQLKKLRNCSVIEGSLQINTIFDSSSDPLDISTLSFPHLKEITGFLMLFSTQGLPTLNQLFPKLALIRGQELVEEYALLIFKMHDLQEVNLPALTDIEQGGVWIVENENLCYVDTINWPLIIKDPRSLNITSKRNGNNCPSCERNCVLGRDDVFCWSKTTCQHRCPRCPNSCTVKDKLKCCDAQCVGGCRGNTKDKCSVCKRINIFNPNNNGTICEEKCPKELYEYLGRRCLTSEECAAIKSLAPFNHRLSGNKLQGKLYISEDGNRHCVLDCPLNTRKITSNNTQLYCSPCEGGICRKNCPGGNVDTIEAARKMRGCTRINGHLKVHIRAQTGGLLTVVSELKKNLGQIQVIDDFLLVSYTYALYSLEFLQSLKTIKGNVLSDNRYALVVKSNENIEDLWGTRNVTIENPNATVLFHSNPKLCPPKIYKFLQSSGLNVNVTLSQFDIGFTNGDKTSCNTKKLIVKEISVSEASVDIKWENFARNLTEPSFLLNYEVHYKPTLNKDEKKFAFRDPCGQDGWFIVDQSPYRYSGRDFSSAPEWDTPLALENLEPYTIYAIFVKAVVLPSTLYALNNDMGAESDMIYIQTHAGEPEKPANLQLFNGQSIDSIVVQWSSSSRSNGPLSFFKISVEIYNEQPQSQPLNYCSSNFTKPNQNVILPKVDEDEITISTSTSRPRRFEPDTGSLEETKILDIILGNHLFTGVLYQPSTNSDNSTILHRRKRHSQMPIISLQNWSENFTEYVLVDPGKTEYVKELNSLKHYTLYIVGIQACRNITDIVCSQMRQYWIDTPASPTADIVVNISLQFVNSTLYIQWEEPLYSNGPVLAYYIALKKQADLQGSETKWNWAEQCVSQEQFLKDNYSFVFPEPLVFPGNYSVRIKTKTHAQTSAFSLPIYFMVDSAINLGTSQSESYWLWIFLPVNLLLLGCIAIAFVLIRKLFKKKVNYNSVTSANPGYFSVDIIPPEWTIPLAALKIDRSVSLGGGSFGTVYPCIYSESNKSNPKIKIICAVKELKNPTEVCISEDEDASKQLEQLIKEALRMTRLDCVHVIKLLGIVSEHPILIVMEYMAKGDLQSYLRKIEPNIPIDLFFLIAAQIADGMSYIHNKNIIHKDLAARNCLVDENLRVVVGDFGLSKEASDYYQKGTAGRFPVRWMAPEWLRDNKVTRSADVWSYGVVLWEMMTRKTPYLDIPDNGRAPLSGIGVMNFVTKGGTLVMPETSPIILTQIAQDCWRFNNHERPSFPQILDRLMPTINSEEFSRISFHHSAEGLSAKKMENLGNDIEEIIPCEGTSLLPYLESTNGNRSNLKVEIETAQVHYRSS